MNIEDNIEHWKERCEMLTRALVNEMEKNEKNSRAYQYAVFQTRAQFLGICVQNPAIFECAETNGEAVEKIRERIRLHHDAVMKKAKKDIPDGM